ncbi:MAG: NhaP-type Na+/H+ or K+/H+ antiporter [Desulforhopalus sp.]|jgi:NhaP-type Na+/H+ or K+/H+ antiporter
MVLIVIFISLVFFYGLFSERIERTIFTAPILFTTAGMLMFLFLPDIGDTSDRLEAFLQLAEVGLVLLLFTDASRTDLQTLKNIRSLPIRLLSTGLLFSIVLGALAAVIVFPGLSIWEAGILAAILAPTDAGLGQVIVNSPHVPMKIRQALNVEAGLNDGLSVPFLLFFIAFASVSGEDQSAHLSYFIMQQLGYGVLVGAGIGLLGGWLLGLAQKKNWMAQSWQQLAVVMVPLCCAITAETVGASMFIAAFVAGLAVQIGYREVGKHSVEFTEEWGQLVNLSIFFLFGLLVALTFQEFNLKHLLYAIISLTLVRMIPVWLALKGTRLSRATVLFMGWFGPRGLASIVLGLVYLEQELHLPGEATIQLALMLTVLLSIFAHGLSAIPGISVYTRKVAALPSSAPELEEVETKK